MARDRGEPAGHRARPGDRHVNRFRIHAPTSLIDASTLLTQLDGATAYAGGTELLLAMKMGFLRFGHLVDVKGIGELAGLRVDADRGEIAIGASVTHRRIEKSAAVNAAFPLLAGIERTVGNVRVRNSGTIGGNLCFAEPHSDIAALAVLLGARLHVVSASGERVIDAADFLLGPFETALTRGELLREIVLPMPSPRTGIGYRRFAVKERPLVVAAAALTTDAQAEVLQATVAIGGVTPTPERCAAADALREHPLMRVRELAAEVGGQVAASADVISDLEGGEDHKRQVVAVLVKRALWDAIDDAEEKART